MRTRYDDAQAEGATEFEKADIAVSERLTTERRHPAMRALGSLGELGDQAPLFALSGAVLAFGLLSGRSRVAAAGANMLLSIAAATAIKTAVKNTVSRTRPHVLLDEGTYEVRPLGPDEGPWHSFPSGHTAGSVAAARAVARNLPEAAIPAYAAAGAIAAAQIPTAHHYPSDVIAGALAGIAADAAVELALAFAFGRTAERPSPDAPRADSG